MDVGGSNGSHCLCHGSATWLTLSCPFPYFFFTFLFFPYLLPSSHDDLPQPKATNGSHNPQIDNQWLAPKRGGCSAGGLPAAEDPHTAVGGLPTSADPGASGSTRRRAPVCGGSTRCRWQAPVGGGSRNRCLRVAPRTGGLPSAAAPRAAVGGLQAQAR